jgi:hypothetical protein
MKLDAGRIIFWEGQGVAPGRESTNGTFNLRKLLIPRNARNAESAEISEETNQNEKEQA